MPFDPTKPYETVTPPPASAAAGGSDATSKTAASGGFDPSKPYDTVPKTSAAQPAVPLTPGQQVMKSVKNVPHRIAEDFRSGLELSRESLKGGFFAGPKAAMAALEVASSPITGAAKALAGDPARANIPQDTVWGRLAANTIEDAALIFGPAAAEQFAAKLPKMVGPARELMENGVQLTLGQLEPKFLKRMEEAAKSVPILGHFIRAAEKRTFDSWNVATVNRALAPIGEKISDAKTGREAGIAAHQLADKKYQEIRDGVTRFVRDPQFDSDIRALQTAMGDRGEDMMKRLDRILENRVWPKFGTVGHMNGAQFKQMESEIGTLASEARAAHSPTERDFGVQLNNLQGIIRRAVARQYPNYAKELFDINQTYAMLTDIQRAGANKATAGGMFTPGDLLGAIKKADKSQRKTNFFEGDARELQQWAEKAQEVIGNKLPDSGTTERALWDVGGAGGLHYLDPTGMAIPTIAAGSALYSKPGQAVINAAAQNLPDALGVISGVATRGAVVPNVAEQLGLK